MKNNALDTLIPDLSTGDVHELARGLMIAEINKQTIGDVLNMLFAELDKRKANSRQAAASTQIEDPTKELQP